MNTNEIILPKTAIILAGGLGTRLRPVIDGIPKPMAPVRGKPFIAYLMDYWIDQGIENFVLSIGYLGAKIREYFGNEYRNKLVCYSVEHTPLGTGGGLRQALSSLNADTIRAVMLNGDTWYEVDLAEMCATTTLPITLALKPMPYSDRYSGVEVDSHERITAFGVETKNSILINGGCYLIETKVISEMLLQFPAKFSLEKDFLVPMARRKLVGASIQNRYFLDIGIPEDYKLAANILPL